MVVGIVDDSRAWREALSQLLEEHNVDHEIFEPHTSYKTVVCDEGVLHNDNDLLERIKGTNFVVLGADVTPQSAKKWWDAGARDVIRKDESSKTLAYRLQCAHIQLTQAKWIQFLHDEVLQNLTCANLSLDRGDPIRAQEILTQLTATVREVLANTTRENDARYVDADFVSAITRESGWFGDLSVNVSKGYIPAVAVSFLQEGIHNAAKHSHASALHVSLTHLHGLTHVKVSDNGIGLTHPVNTDGHFGMLSQRERALRLRGVFHVGPSFTGEGIAVSLDFLNPGNISV